MKKDKEILLELECQVREINQQFVEQLKSLDTRLEMNLNLLWELLEMYKKRAEAEAEYGKNLEKMVKQISLRHKDNKQKREGWLGYSTYNAWQGVLVCARDKGKDHSMYSEVISNYVVTRLVEISEDMQRIHKKSKEVILACQDDIKKVLNELVKSMKTYHLYHGESQVAESKLKRVQTQREKSDQQNLIAKKFVNYEKKNEKKKAKYTENKLKALRARNDYLLNIDTANVALVKYFSEDFPRMVKKVDQAFQTMVARIFENDLTAYKVIVNNESTRTAVLYQGILGIQSGGDHNIFKGQWSKAFNQPQAIQFHAHKGDEVFQLSAQKLVQEEMVQRMEQVKSRIQKIKEEKEEMDAKLDQGEELYFERLRGQKVHIDNYVVDTPPVKSPTEKNKDAVVKHEEALFEMYKEMLLKENLLHRLQAKHEMLGRALGEGSEIDYKDILARPPSLPPKPKKKSKAIKSRPSLFGGDIEEYVKATGEHIPVVMKSCIHVINQFGMHHQGIFRVSGSFSERANYKALFENGEDPLQDKMDGDDINTVADLLKLYFRELKQPLFTFNLYESLIKCSQTVYASTSFNSNNSGDSVSEVDWKTQLSDLLSTLSPERIVIMRFLFAFLNHVTEHSDENMMEAFNLSICFGPTLLYAPPERTDQHQFQNYINDLVKNIIINQDELFPPPTKEDYDNNAVYEKYYIYPYSMSDDDAVKDPLAEEDEDLDKNEAVVNENYSSQSEKELSVSRGDIVQLLNREGDNWWVECSGKQGLLPDRVLTYGKGGTLFRYNKATRGKSSEYLHSSNSNIQKSSSHSNILTQTHDVPSGKPARASAELINDPTNVFGTESTHQHSLLVPVLPPVPRHSFRQHNNSTSSSRQASPFPGQTADDSSASELDIQVSPPTSSLDVCESSTTPLSPTAKFHPKEKKGNETASLGRASFNIKSLPSNQSPPRSSSTSSKWRSLPHGSIPPTSQQPPNNQPSTNQPPPSYSTPPANQPSTQTTTDTFTSGNKAPLEASLSLNSDLFRHHTITTSTNEAPTTTTTHSTLPRISEKFPAPPALKTKPVIRKRTSAEGISTQSSSFTPSSSVVHDSPTIKPSKIFQNVQQQKQLQKQQQSNSAQKQQQQQINTTQKQSNTFKQQSSINITPGSTFNYKKPSSNSTSSPIDSDSSTPDAFNNERNQFSSFKISSKK